VITFLFPLRPLFIWFFFSFPDRTSMLLSIASLSFFKNFAPLWPRRKGFLFPWSDYLPFHSGSLFPRRASSSFFFCFSSDSRTARPIEERSMLFFLHQKLPLLGLRLPFPSSVSFRRLEYKEWRTFAPLAEGVFFFPKTIAALTHHSPYPPS